jgi:pimeloyl-ACP methyl ester carboxylesterase
MRSGRSDLRQRSSSSCGLPHQSPAWASEGTEQIRAALPNARVAILPGQAHMAHLTAPELLADEIARFLSDSTAAAATR